jgi:hypothetical protein
MANLAVTSLNRGVRRLSKWTLVSIAFIVLALMALSFVLGRATIGDTGTSQPVSHTVPQPASVTHGGLDCRQHERC